MKFEKCIWIVACASLVGSCSSSQKAWKPDLLAMQKVADLDPESKSQQVAKVLSRYFYDAATRNGTQVPNMKQTMSRNRASFEDLREYFEANAPVNDGFNVCFPKTYATPTKSELRMQIIFAMECRLIQMNGLSVSELREDPLVAKHLGADGQLRTSEDPGQMHEELNSAIFRLDPTDDKRDLYPEASARIRQLWNVIG
jgi:hypothetical protein